MKLPTVDIVSDRIWVSTRMLYRSGWAVMDGTVRAPLNLTGATWRSAKVADSQYFFEPSTWVTGRNIEAQSHRHGRTSMANDSEVTLWEDLRDDHSLTH